MLLAAVYVYLVILTANMKTCLFSPFSEPSFKCLKTVCMSCLVFLFQNRQAKILLPSCVSVLISLSDLIALPQTLPNKFPSSGVVFSPCSRMGRDLGGTEKLWHIPQ